MKRSKDTLGLGELLPANSICSNALPVPAPLLDLVELALVGVAGVVGFFSGPVVRHRYLLKVQKLTSSVMMKCGMTGWEAVERG
jgi:hypothetical protein